MRQLLTVLAVCLFGGSCSYAVPDIPSVPANPTYDHDIWPLFQDHCLLCHSSPPDHGAPTYFRLDVYSDVTNDGNTVSGAQTMAGTAVYDVQIKRMPPGAKSGDGVGPNGLQMLLNWQNSVPPFPK
jgi:hypothetical protein